MTRDPQHLDPIKAEDDAAWVDWDKSIYEAAWRDAWDVFVATQHPPIPVDTNAELVVKVGFAAYERGRAEAFIRSTRQPSPMSNLTLVAAVRALPRYTTPDGEETYVEWAALEVALSAPAPSEGLDVERLRDALLTDELLFHGPPPESMKEHVELAGIHATRLAAEYARLSESAPEGGEG